MTRFQNIWRGSAIGVLAGAAAVGTAELVAAFVRPEASPIIAVGSRLIVATPEPLKEFAIRTFGENDKTVLLAGIYAALGLFAMLVGIAALRRLVLGVAGILAFALAGAVAAATQYNSGPLDVLPSIVGAATGVAALLALLSRRRVAADATPSDDAVPAATPRERATTDRAPAVDDEATDDEAPGKPRLLLGAAAPVGRRFVLVAAGTVVLAGLTGFGGRALQAARFSVAASRARVRIPTPASPASAVPAGADLRVPGITPWRTPNATFYRVDTALTPPQVAVEDWQLRIHGMVDRELTLSYEELANRPLIERDITLTCVSNEVGGPYVGNARWIGAPLKDLLAEVGVHPDADQLVSRSVDGMTIGTPTAIATDGRDAMLAIAMNGEPLPVVHGFPVRMVVPGLYGYVSACKWITDLELTTFDAYDPYWVRRKWAAKAPIKTQARIDTPKPFAHVRPGRVTIGGVAWAQHRGIVAVEVQLDDGPWRRARLATATSTDTWRQWTYTWEDAEPGDHSLSVRATDGTGAVQTDRRAEPFPSGAAGQHTLSITVDG